MKEHNIYFYEVSYDSPNRFVIWDSDVDIIEDERIKFIPLRKYIKKTQEIKIIDNIPHKVDAQVIPVSLVCITKASINYDSGYYITIKEDLDEFIKYHPEIKLLNEIQNIFEEGKHFLFID